MKKIMLCLGAILLVGCSATNSNEQVNDTTTTTTQSTTETTTTVAKTEVRVYEKENPEEDATERVTLKAKSGMMETMMIEYVGKYPENIKTENDRRMFKHTIDNLAEQEGNDLKKFKDLGNLSGVSTEFMYGETEWIVILTYHFAELDVKGLSEADILDADIIDTLKASQNHISIDFIAKDFVDDGYTLVKTGINS